MTPKMMRGNARKQAPPLGQAAQAPLAQGPAARRESGAADAASMKM
jgi:hypothetical protein